MPTERQPASRRARQQRRSRVRKGKAIVPGKRYRKTYRLRPCVRPLFCLLALAVLGLERQIGRMFEMNDLLSVFYKRNSDDFKPRISTVLPLNYTATHNGASCPRPLRRIFDIHREKAFQTTNMKIPQVVHQFSKDRCLAEQFHSASLKWLFPRWGYYMHSEDSLNRVLLHDYPEFPQLKATGTDCLVGSRTRHHLWKFLVLWMYGGVYVDLNYAPAKFTKTAITGSDDAIVMLEADGTTLSTKFLATSPRHPILFMSIQNALQSIRKMEKKIASHSQLDDLMKTALNKAFLEFRRLAGSSNALIGRDKGKLQSIVYHGPNHHSVRIAGNLQGDGGMLRPLFNTESEELEAYAKMGMGAGGDSAETASESRCIRAVLEKTGSLTQIQLD